MVVVIVPAFSQGNDRQPDAVLAFLTGLITAGAEHVAEGINRESGVIKDDGADDVANDQAHPSVHQKAKQSEGKRRQQESFVQPDQLRIFGQILNGFRVILIVFIG